MMNTITTQTVEWLAATGAPNGIVILTLLTHPAMWSEKAQKTVSTAYQRWTDRLSGTGGGA